MKLAIIWLEFIVIMSFVQYYIIEQKQRKPNKMFWLAIRGIAFGLVLWQMMQAGYYWYWAAPFLVFTFAMFFPVLLNLLRPDKPIFYMSARGDWFDKLIVKNMHLLVYWSFLYLLGIAAISFFIVYGRCSWEVVNSPYLAC